MELLKIRFHDKTVFSVTFSQRTVPLRRALLTYTWGENVPGEEDEGLKVGFALDRCKEACRPAHWLHL